jgi:hypothetical protein
MATGISRTQAVSDSTWSVRHVMWPPGTWWAIAFGAPFPADEQIAVHHRGFFLRPEDQHAAALRARGIAEHRQPD